MFPALKEAEDRLAAKQGELKSIFDEAGPDLDMSKVKSVSGDSAAIVEHIRALNAELDELGKKAGELREVQAAADRAARIPSQRESGDGAKGGPTGGEREVKSFGQQFVESDAFRLKQGPSGPEAHLDVEVKTLMQTTAGWAPEVTRSGRVEFLAIQPYTAADVFPTTTTTQVAIKWMKETVVTNNAAEVAEAGLYPESALQLAEDSAVVQKIATWIPVTDEQLEDEPRARAYVDNRLGFMIRQRLGSQVLNGNGTAPNLRGLLNTVGIQTQAKGADVAPDAIYKALTKVRTVGLAMPGVVLMNPTDWQNIRLLKTADGIYIWGSPSEAGPERIWGLPIVQEFALTAGTAVTGDFANFSELAMRRGLDIQITNAHADFFINGKQAIRADIRAALAIYRPAAFCTVTGL